MNLAEFPAFIPPHVSVDPGRDYLGLEALNMAMFDGLFTGMNNVVSQVRPSALLTWVVWKYPDIEISNLTASGFTVFREKVEALFVWSHQIHGDQQGMPGAEQQEPKDDQLTFAAVSRGVASYWAATTYGPALKSPNAVGLIYETDELSGLFKVTDEGRVLAMAFDEALRTKLDGKDYSFLASMQLTLTRKRASVFYSAWNQHEPSNGESKAYCRAFYRPHHSGSGKAHGLRANAIAFVLATLASALPGTAVTPSILRLQMTYGPCPQGGGAISEVEMEKTRRRWQALQIRQHQRLALEALFGWLERCLWHRDASSIQEVCSLTVEAVQNYDVDPNTLLSRHLKSYRDRADTADGLLLAGLGDDPKFDLMQKGLELLSEMKKTFIEDYIVYKALDILCHCAVLTERILANDVSAKDMLFSEQVTRLPPAWLLNFLNNYEQESFGLFIEQLFETHILARHLGVAASRVKDDKNRARFSFEDSGLRSILPSARDVLRPKFGGDRLANMMALMGECGLLTFSTPRQYTQLSAELQAVVRKESSEWFELGPAAIF